MPTPATLNLNQSSVAFSDSTLTNNPQRKHFDWTRNQNGIQVSSPRSEQFVVPARTTMSLFSGLRATTLDGTTTFSITYYSSLVDPIYRIKYTGGTDPSFATDTPLSFLATVFTVAVNANQTVTLTAGAGTPFTGVTVGQYIYIFTTTDDALAGFNALNAGIWQVLGNAGNTVLTLARPSGTSFSGYAETTAAMDASHNMIAYTLNKVQVGDKVRITAGFSIDTLGTYTVYAVTSKWIDVLSSAPLANQTGIIPGATGLVIYSSGKRYVRVEVDQNANVYFNGAADESQEIDPWVAGDAANMGWQERIGPVWSLSIKNLANTPMTVNLFTAE